jgi:tetratricopeptide (TPR) repeat protein
LVTLGHSLSWSDDVDAARECYEQALESGLRIVDPFVCGTAHTGLGELSMRTGECARAREHLEAARSYGRTIASDWGTAAGLACFGQLAWLEGKVSEARTLYERALVVVRRLGDRRLLILDLLSLAVVRSEAGDLEGAARDADEPMSLAGEMGNPILVAHAAYTIGRIACGRDDWPRGREHLTQALRLAQERSVSALIAACLEVLAAIASREGAVERAARLFGASESLREARVWPRATVDQARHEGEVEAARAALGEKAFTAAWEAGRRMTLDEAVSEALTFAEK